MTALKITQLASYQGNFGDRANVLGTRYLLEKNLKLPLKFTNIEYLEYTSDPRWGGKKFNDDFIKLANKSDLLLIGGGGFFELGSDQSYTATSLDMTPEFLSKIKVPIVFYALGFHLTYGLTKDRKQKFEKFFSLITNRPNTLVSLRNDGSLERLEKVYGAKYTKNLDICPDGGFFTPQASFDHIELPKSKKPKTIGIQLAGDLLDIRFNSHNNGKMNWLKFNSNKSLTWQSNYDTFLKVLSRVIIKNLQDDDNLNIVLIPHIPVDLKIIYDFLLNYVGPPYTRKRITVAPYLSSLESTNYILDLYKRCDVVLGMRFHGNVCPIGVKTPTIGLATFDQIDGLYEELGLTKYMVSFKDPNLETKLSKLISYSFTNRPQIVKTFDQIGKKLQNEVNSFHQKIKTHLL